jgi:tyrosine-protein kinase Etk/Wzc
MATTVEQHEVEVRGPIPGRFEDPPGAEISILDILLVLARGRWFIVLFTVATTIAGLTLALMAQPKYTAKTVILPPQQGGSGSSGMMAELSSLGALGGLAGGGLGLKNPADMYVALFRSETVENGVIKQFNLQRLYRTDYPSIARRTLESQVQVGADNKSSLITISVVDQDPRRAAAIANGYVDQYRHLSENLAISEAAQRRLFFDRQLIEAKNNLAAAEESLVKTQQKTGLVELGSQARALIESAASLRAEVAAKEVQIQGMQTYAAADNSGLVQAQQELAGLRAQLSKLGGNGDVTGDGLIVPGGKVPTASLEYARKLRDVKYNETIFNILARQFEMAKLDEAREGALVQVVDPATVPDYKSSPKRATWTIVALALGFVLSTLLVLARAAMRFLHRDPETDSKLLALRGMLLPGRAAGRRRA